MSEQEKKSSAIKRQRLTIGSIVEIKVEDYFVYAQITENKNLAFFDYQAPEPLNSFEILEHAPILFIVGVYFDVITRGVWLKVGKMPLRKECQGTFVKYIFDTINYKFELYITNKNNYYTVSSLNFSLKNILEPVVKTDKYAENLNLKRENYRRKENGISKRRIYNFLYSVKRRETKKVRNVR